MKIFTDSSKSAINSMRNTIFFFIRINYNNNKVDNCLNNQRFALALRLIVCIHLCCYFICHLELSSNILVTENVQITIDAYNFKMACLRMD